MTEAQQAALQHVLRSSRALITALHNASPQLHRGAEQVAELVAKDEGRLRKAMTTDEDKAILLALVYPSLDARAADNLGGVDFDGDPFLNAPYLALVDSRMAARELFVWPDD
jgi:hypothetical protein